MLEVTAELKELLTTCNQQLQEKYNYQSAITEQKLRQLIATKLGKFNNIEKLKPQLLEKWTSGSSIIGVDGSVNTIGKVYPHYLTVLQALAKNTIKSEAEIISHAIFSPLIERDRDKIFKKLKKEAADNAQEAAGKIRSSLLASLEVEVAKQSIEQWQPKLIMLDGSLSRYQFQDEESWKELVELATAADVLLVGVIEEIATHKISENLADELPAKMQRIYDREVLFGLLEPGELLQIDDISLTHGFKKGFLRSARDPGVIGLEMIKEQQSDFDVVAQVVYTLTPQDGRGIPIWLDIVDNEVRLTNQMMEAMVDNYIDPDLKQRLFHSKRNDRVY
ncbi:MAG: DNA double-strand break repair nuclease NurA [Bacillota bacterium]